MLLQAQAATAAYSGALCVIFWGIVAYAGIVAYGGLLHSYWGVAAYVGRVAYWGIVVIIRWGIVAATAAWASHAQGHPSVERDAGTTPWRPR